ARVATRNTPGPGCPLASALAAFTALGHKPADAARLAKDYINAAIVAGAGYSIGHGHGPVHHFYAFW
ncbi:MAG: bifunctional hydroxymethylpyrimidine kinase/phosphomethylpyrimidine kinase, partial [Muribaculaceae bacterium]|nr:bifunctional hydroxymethylpyrimidine kinase/phosphomethylpyrimidine kinase [Muribaculaceae bacterium]